MASSPDVSEALDEGDGAHGPVAAEGGGQQQEPSIDTQQVVVGELSGRRRCHTRWVVESEEERDVAALVLCVFCLPTSVGLI